MTCNTLWDFFCVTTSFTQLQSQTAIPVAFLLQDSIQSYTYKHQCPVVAQGYCAQYLTVKNLTIHVVISMSGRSAFTLYDRASGFAHFVTEFEEQWRAVKQCRSRGQVYDPYGLDKLQTTDSKVHNRWMRQQRPDKHVLLDKDLRISMQLSKILRHSDHGKFKVRRDGGVLLSEILNVRAGDSLITETLDPQMLAYVISSNSKNRF